MRKPSPLLRTFAKVWMKPLTLLALILPGAYVVLEWTLALSGFPHDMGFNPVQWTHHFLGETALRILLVSLAITPLRDITGWAPIILIRRRIGLAAFFYALAHLLAYVWLDLDWSMPKLWEDILQRTYITLGMGAVAGLIPLAITSTNGMIRRMGRQAWQRLHYLVYPIAILAVAHHFFAEKGIQMGPLIHGAILAFLLAWRLVKFIRLRIAAAQPA
ncbi:MAG: protein-methionine-sulfoxide reductase heme-binding subunit MsrQ [Hyphomonadaceae bacterium]